MPKQEWAWKRLHFGRYILWTIERPERRKCYAIWADTRYDIYVPYCPGDKEVHTGYLFLRDAMNHCSQDARLPNIAVHHSWVDSTLAYSEPKEVGVNG